MVTQDNDLKRIQSLGWNFPESVWLTLSDYEKSFALLEFDGIKAPNYYRQRLKMIDFAECGRVLDAACGMGQWSNALAELNNEVEGIDLMDSRINVAKTLTNAQKNICKFQIGSIEKLPFPDASFDGVFCYGAFMFTNMKVTLKEFSRVLRPGGRLYINGNTWGWYAHLIIDRGIRGGNYSLIKTASRMILNTFVRKSSQIVVTEYFLRKSLSKTGFIVLALDAEGKICMNKSKKQIPPSAYPSKYYKMRSMIETIAQKSL